MSVVSVVVVGERVSSSSSRSMSVVMGRVWVMMDPPCVHVHGHGQETSLQHSSKFSSA